jgi:ornithine carbamoyltransferase
VRGPRHFLAVTDLSPSELRAVMALAERPIASLGRPLEGQGVALIFEKPSNRTRQSMEIAVVQLGHPVHTQADEVGFDVRVEQYPQASEAVEGADALYADVWTSRGQEAQSGARRRAFDGFAVTPELMSLAADGALFFHCLPAHRGDEVAAEVIDGPRSRVFAQAHNRLHASRGLLAFLAGVRP